jgi:hypothetical protein
MACDLSIAGNDRAFFILAGKREIAGPYTSNGNAVAALRGVEARIAPVTIRACLTCSTHFKSRGRGNRLCPSCTRET